ncbi:MAG: shikimate kinase [Tepidiformaceae bacterium]
MRRVVVYGNSGAGKSTLGRALAGRLGLPYIELDAIYHSRPNWDDLSPDELRVRVREVLAENPDGWVIDGNYSAARDIILPLADTAIWLKLPFRIVYVRLWKRTLGRRRRHELLWGTNRESMRDLFFSRESILLWGVTHWRTSQHATTRDLATIPHTAKVITLRSPRQVDALLSRVMATDTGPTD